MGNINKWSPISPSRLFKRFLADAVHKGQMVYQLGFIKAYIQSDTTIRIFLILDRVYKMFCPELGHHFGRPLNLEKYQYDSYFSCKSWYDTLDRFLVDNPKFIQSMDDWCLYILRDSSKWIVLINYVDDALYYNVTVKLLENSLKRLYQTDLI